MSRGRGAWVSDGAVRFRDKANARRTEGALVPGIAPTNEIHVCGVSRNLAEWRDRLPPSRLSSGEVVCARELSFEGDQRRLAVSRPTLRARVGNCLVQQADCPGGDRAQIALPSTGQRECAHRWLRSLCRFLAQGVNRDRIR